MLAAQSTADPLVAARAATSTSCLACRLLLLTPSVLCRSAQVGVAPYAAATLLRLLPDALHCAQLWASFPSAASLVLTSANLAGTGVVALLERRSRQRFLRCQQQHWE